MVAKPPVRESSTEGIFFLVWLDFRWIGSKPCSAQVYPEDMRFINSQLLWVAVFGFPLCGCKCVCQCVCVRTNAGRNMLILSRTQTRRKTRNDTCKV